MRKIVIGILLFLAVMLTVGFWFASNKIQELPELNQDFFDQQVSAFLKSDKSSGIIAGGEYEIENLTVILHDKTIEIHAQLNASRSGFSGYTDFSIQGYPVYREGKFYFFPDQNHPPDFHEFKIQGKLKPAKSLLGRYAEKAPGLKKYVDKAAENVLADNQLMEDTTIVVINHALNRFPIYTLGDSIPEKAAAVAIDEFKVENSILVITVSFWNLAVHLILMMLAAFLSIGLAFAMMRNPNLFVGMFALSSLS